MQIEKFHKAQELRKEILELEAAMTSTTNLEKLNIEMRKDLNGKVADLIKKELSKIIKLKEKEFNDL